MRLEVHPSKRAQTLGEDRFDWHDIDYDKSCLVLRLSSGMRTWTFVPRISFD